MQLTSLRDFRLYLPNPGFSNPPWGGAGFKVLILRLSPFADVQRSTPHLFLYREVRAAMPDAFIDMAFLPSEHDALALEGAGLPLALGTQSHAPIKDFSLVLISNSWLLEQVNLPFLLARSGVPLWSSERGEEWPPLVLGGSNVSAAHALVAASGDSFADAFFFGEGEGSVGRIARLWRDGGGGPRRERLAAIAAEVPGFWPAGDLARAARKAVADVGRVAAPLTADASDAAAPVLPGPEAATARLPITFGCPCLCSFCFEGHDRAPFREIPADQILLSARSLKLATGADTLEIESFNFNTHAEIDTLLLGLHRLFHRVNMMSQRVDILARTAGLLDLEIAADKTSFTLGVEGISGAMRRYLHKSLEDGEIRQVLEALHGRRIREIKLFFILTGREGDADLEEFAGLVKWLRQTRERSEAAPRVVFSFGFLVRMPATPLRHDPPVLDEQAWRQPAGRVKSICETHGFEFRLALPWADYVATQALALGSHDLHELVVRLAGFGCVSDRGLGPEATRAVAEWIDQHRDGLEAEKPLGARFGFPFLETDATRKRLYSQYEAARDGRDAGYCRHGLPGTEACATCTGCTRVPRRATAITPGMAPAARRLHELMERKHHLRPVLARARLPRESAGLGCSWAGPWLLRAVLAAHPEQTDNVLSIEEAWVHEVLPDDVPWFGETIVAITAWDVPLLVSALDAPGSTVGPLVSAPAAAAQAGITARVTLPHAEFPDPGSRLAEALRDMHAPVTVLRDGKRTRFVPSEKSLKKKLLTKGTCERTGEGHRLELVLGGKPFLGEWLASFSGPQAVRRALVEFSR